MKRVGKSKIIKEPTITNVMSAVQDLAEAVQVGFAKVEDRFDGVESRLDGVEYRMTALEKRTGFVEDGIEDMKETLDGIARATDKDSIIIIGHERRIRHLEKAQI